VNPFSLLNKTHSQMLGTFILWFGWYGFNSCSTLSITSPEASRTAALAAVNTTLAAGFAGVTALFFNMWYVERQTGEATFNLVFAMNGVLAGLVSITAGCGVMEPWAAMITGICAGLIYWWVSRLLIKLCLDDAVDAIPVHGANGIWGVISVGLFASPDRLSDAYGNNEHVGIFFSIAEGKFDITLLAIQLVGIIFIVSWVFFMLMPFFIWLNYIGWFRADSLEELVGLDVSYHGGSAHVSEDVKSEYVKAFQKRKDEEDRKSTKTYDDDEDFADHNGDSMDRMANVQEL
jgi:Amt family ammonium transporter